MIISAVPSRRVLILDFNDNKSRSDSLNTFNVRVGERTDRPSRCIILEARARKPRAPTNSPIVF